MFNTVILIGRLGKNAVVKTEQNNKDYVVLSVATSETWKNDKGEYETRTEWHRVYAWGNLANFAKTLQKGQLVSLEGQIKYRTVEEEVEGKPFRHTIAEIHASSMKRLSKSRRLTIRRMGRTRIRPSSTAQGRDHPPLGNERINMPDRMAARRTSTICNTRGVEGHATNN